MTWYRYDYKQSFTRKTYETRSLTLLFLILKLIKRDREFVSSQNENVLFQVHFPFIHLREHHHSLSKYISLSCWLNRTPARSSSGVLSVADRPERILGRWVPSRGSKAAPLFLVGRKLAISVRNSSFRESRDLHFLHNTVSWLCFEGTLSSFSSIWWMDWACRNTRKDCRQSLRSQTDRV